MSSRMVLEASAPTRPKEKARCGVAAGSEAVMNEEREFLVYERHDAALPQPQQLSRGGEAWACRGCEASLWFSFYPMGPLPSDGKRTTPHHGAADDPPRQHGTTHLLGIHQKGTGSVRSKVNLSRAFKAGQPPHRFSPAGAERKPAKTCAGAAGRG